jgi:hypothetical protein
MSEKTRVKIIVIICVVLGAGIVWGYAGLSIKSLLVGGICGFVFSAVSIHLEYLFDEWMEAAKLIDHEWEE